MYSSKRGRFVVSFGSTHVTEILLRDNGLSIVCQRSFLLKHNRGIMNSKNKLQMNK